jgi:predicted dehydrogenase
LNDLLDGYPVELLKNLVRAARENRRRTLVEATLGFSVAVCNALDLAFSGGKGRILETWLASMENAESEKTDPRPRKRLMTSRALQWFQNLPVSKETKVNG